MTITLSHLTRVLKVSKKSVKNNLKGYLSTSSAGKELAPIKVLFFLHKRLDTPPLNRRQDIKPLSNSIIPQSRASCYCVLLYPTAFRV